MKVFFQIFAVTLSILLLASIPVSAHDAAKNILVNNALLLKPYNGPIPSSFDIPAHFMEENFLVGESINFKVLMSLVGIERDTKCNVAYGEKNATTRDYEINYAGIDLFYKGEEFDISFDQTGSYNVEISCTYEDDDREVYNEEVQVNIGNQILFPSDIKYGEESVKFKSTIQVNAGSTFKLEFDNDEFEYTWDIDGEAVYGKEVSIIASKKTNPFFVVVRFVDKLTGQYSQNFVRINQVPVVDNVQNPPQSNLNLIVIISCFTIAGVSVSILLIRKQVKRRNINSA